METLQVLHK